MKLSIGIVGLPNVGKSTLFKLLTKQDITIANYPFATIDPNVGVVSVPDERLSKLTEISGSAKTIPAVVEFYDIAGLVKGASTGEGLGNQFLGHIGETSAVLLVVRCFEGGGIIHVDGSVDPIRDLEVVQDELLLKDLEVAERALEKVTREARSGDKDAVREKEALEAIIGRLGDGELLWTWQDATEDIFDVAREQNLLTAKPQIVLLNGKEEDVSEQLVAKIAEMGAEYVVIDLGGEELLHSSHDRGKNVTSDGDGAHTDGDVYTGGGVSKLITKAYSILDLMSFFTTGEKETRAWTVAKGTKAPQASGVIHSDFEEKFIRAEVVSYDQFVEGGGWNGAKQKGWVRVEGKEYEVQDGDILLVRHG